MILAGILLSVASTIALASLSLVVDRAIGCSADPVERAFHRVFPGQSQILDQKYSPPWVKVLSACLILALALGIILTGVGLFRASNSLLWRGGLIYLAIGIALGLRHLATGK